jgi:hypothetical protein
MDCTIFNSKRDKNLYTPLIFSKYMDQARLNEALKVAISANHCWGFELYDLLTYICGTLYSSIILPLEKLYREPS